MLDSMEKYQLPCGWQWKRLGDLCELVYGNALAQHSRECGNVPVYGSNGIIGYHNIPMTDGPTIIVGRKGSIGKVKYSEIPCWIIDTAYYVKPSVNCDLEFLYRLLAGLNLGKLDKSSAIPGLNRDDVYNITIPLPPLAEQRRIATIIEKKLAAVEKAKKAAAEQQEAVGALAKVYLREVFEFDELPEGWEWKRLADIAELITKGTTPTTLGFSFQPKGINFIKIESINENGTFLPGKFSYISDECHSALSRSQLKKNDILFSIAGALGQVAMVNENVLPANTNQANAIIRIPQDIVDCKYLLPLLKSDIVFAQFDKLKRGNGRLNLSLEDIRNVTIPLPPLPEQRRIAAIIEKKLASVEKLKTYLAEQAETINALPAAILRKAFAGAM
jgi:type I restriction enzyme S subunit